MNIGYIRVSTKEQNIDRQIDRLKEAGCDRVFVDKRTGKNTDRPELNKMFDLLREGDTVMVTELSRLGRSHGDIVTMTMELERLKVNLRVLDVEWLDTSTPAGQFFFMSMSLMDELRRKTIVENTKEGLRSARARGRVGGRPKADENAVKTALKMYNSKQHTIKEIVSVTGISQGTLYKRINEEKEGVTG